MSTQPGWYKDPQNPALLRWWNGAAWSEQTMVPKHTFADPAETAAQNKPKIKKGPARRGPNFTTYKNEKPPKREAPKALKAFAVVLLVAALALAGLYFAGRETFDSLPVIGQ